MCVGGMSFIPLVLISRSRSLRVCVDHDIFSWLFRGEMGRTHLNNLLLRVMILSMVAEVVVAVGEEGIMPNDHTTNMATMSKAFASATKLTECNFMIWYAGFLTVLVGLAGDPWSRLLEVLELILAQLHQAQENIEHGIATTLFKMRDRATFQTSEEWKKVNRCLFNIIYWTVDDTIAGLKHSLATTMMFKGLEALKYIHDNYGPGCGTTQVGRTIDMISETQKDGEAAALMQKDASFSQGVFRAWLLDTTFGPISSGRKRECHRKSR